MNGASNMSGILNKGAKEELSATFGSLGGGIVVVDLGGQYAHLIARRIREIGVFSEIRALEDLSEGQAGEPAGVIFSGGPDSVTEDDVRQIDGFLKSTVVPVLGICFGHQLLAKYFGGEIEGSTSREYGFATATCDEKSILFRGLVPHQRVWMSHGDHVSSLPSGFRATASSGTLGIAAFESLDGRFFGLQFHPEVSHTERGMDILGNFIRHCMGNAELSPSWTPQVMHDLIIKDIRRSAGDKELFLLVSGGIDSLVTLDLCIRAVGKKRVHSVHIDMGFMRLHESDAVMEYLRQLSYQNLRVVNAQDRFLDALQDIVDPEQKRKVIGRLFVEVFSEHIRAMDITEDWMLVQGTIYPDRIESGGTKRADRIKTHHNRVDEIQAMIEQGRVLEPLRDLYKNEVRALGAFLGLPEAILKRHPFPGPGLAVRIIASDNESPPAGYDRDEELLRSLLEPYGLSGFVLPIRSVGVQGDARTYHHPALIWDEEGRTTMDWDTLKCCAGTLVNRLDSVNRVIFASQRIGRHELLLGKCFLEKPVVDLLRLVDHQVHQMTRQIEEIWQMPVVSLPLFDVQGRQAFVMRPVCSKDAMTADVFEMDKALWEGIIHAVTSINGVGYLFYDITMKPPGTIEWE